jgi:NADH dehydrogenase/NADH:ubiquinone oxidoreductase subunit G
MISGNFIQAKYTKAKTNVYFGSQVNLESLYSFDFFAKSIVNKAPISYNQLKYTANLITDVPLFYSLNKSVNDFILDPLQNIIIVGVNLRYEASLLNTRLRREAKQRGASYVNLGNFSPLAYSQMHKGNSVRSIIALIENRIAFIKEFNCSSNKTAIYIGVNSLRNVNSPFTQQIIRQIAKYFFTHNGNKDRFGYIHSSVGSLAFAHINRLNTGSTGKQAGVSCYIGIKSEQSSTANHNNTRVFSTHFEKDRNHFATTSFYESNGHVISIENNLRKHNKVVTPASKVYSLSTLMNYSIANY